MVADVSIVHIRFPKTIFGDELQSYLFIYSDLILFNVF